MNFSLIYEETDYKLDEIPSGMNQIVSMKQKLQFKNHCTIMLICHMDSTRGGIVASELEKIPSWDSGDEVKSNFVGGGIFYVVLNCQKPFESTLPATQSLL